MTEYCAGMEPQLETPPQCVICLTEITDVPLKQERAEWNWEEVCVLKLFEIKPESLDNFPSLTYFCQKCSLRNQKMWELCSQISPLQQSLQELKLTLETDFKRGFSMGRSDQILDRTNFLRYQLAKSMEIKLPEPIPDTQAVHTVDTNAENDLSQSSQVTSEEPNTERTQPKPMLAKKRERFIGGNVRKRSFKKSVSPSEGLQKGDTQLKHLKIKICAIPPDLLTNLPINVHTIPGYISTPSIRSSSRSTMARQKIKRILTAECPSDEDIPSNTEREHEDEYCPQESILDSDTEFDPDVYFDSESAGWAIVKNHENLRKPATGSKNVKGIGKDSQEIQILVGNQKRSSSESKRLPKATKWKRNKIILTRTKNGFYCTMPECAGTRGFSSKDRLEVHQKKVHEGITHPFKCQDCGKAFRLLSTTKLHYKSIHLGQFSFKCEFCGQGFVSRAALQKHRVIHTKERNYKCSQCPKDFKTVLGRDLHIRYAHTGERPYICDICGKGFVSTSKLNSHLKCVHHREDRPVICHICGKNFPIQGYLYMHMRTHEKEAAAAAGLPVKSKPRWKKKPDAPNLTESVPTLGSHTSFVQQEVVGAVHTREPSCNEADQ